VSIEGVGIGRRRRMVLFYYTVVQTVGAPLPYHVFNTLAFVSRRNVRWRGVWTIWTLCGAGLLPATIVCVERDVYGRGVTPETPGRIVGPRHHVLVTGQIIGGLRNGLYGCGSISGQCTLTSSGYKFRDVGSCVVRLAKRSSSFLGWSVRAASRRQRII
jgi:hypothetical protein